MTKFYVYILQSLKDGKYYVGHTTNLVERLKRHNSGNTRSLKHRTPLRLVYYEEFDTRTKAVQREQYLKSYKGGKQKRELVVSFDSTKLKKFDKKLF